MLRTPMGRLRAATLIEGISYLLLLFVAMPLKYLADIPEAVKVSGWAHGVLFIAVCAALLEVFVRRGLSFMGATAVFIGTLLPFAAFVIDKRLRALESPASGAASLPDLLR